MSREIGHPRFTVPPSYAEKIVPSTNEPVNPAEIPNVLFVSAFFYVSGKLTCIRSFPGSGPDANFQRDFAGGGWTVCRYIRYKTAGCGNRQNFRKLPIPFIGGIAKWLRQRIANPSRVGSTPTLPFLIKAGLSKKETQFFLMKSVSDAQEFFTLSSSPRSLSPVFVSASLAAA